MDGDSSIGTPRTGSPANRRSGGAHPTDRLAMSFPPGPPLRPHNTMGTFMTPFDPFTDPSSVGPRWSLWIQKFELLMDARDVITPRKLRSNLLLNIGDDVLHIFNSLKHSGDQADYDGTKQLLTTHFMPHINPDFEIFTFCTTLQSATETLDAYHARLCRLAMSCEFDDDVKEVRRQVINGLNSEKLRRIILSEKGIPLHRILETGRQRELAHARAATMESTLKSMHVSSLPVASVADKQGRLRRSTTTDKPAPWPQSNKPCGWCGGRRHTRKDCPAQGTTCNLCGRMDHYAKVCRSADNPLDTSLKASSSKAKKKPTRHLEADDGSSSAESEAEDSQTAQTANQMSVRKKKVHMVSALDRGNRLARKRRPHCTVRVNGQAITVTIDTGASVNVFPKAIYNKLQPRPELQPTNTQLFAYGSKHPLPVAGRFRTTLEGNNNTIQSKIYVVDAGVECLLSWQAAEDLGIIKLVCDVSTDDEVQSLLRKHPNLTNGIGCLKGKPVRLHIDPSIEPKAVRHRRTPFHMRPLVEKELNILEEANIIEKVTGPTPWVSPMVVTHKPKQPGKVRICIDMRLPNTAIKRERHITPTIDDIVADLTGSKFFSKIDLNAGYHQVKLHKDSRYITTFSSHIGLRRYKRLNFGISSAAEVFQNAIQTVLQGLPGVLNVSDDILIHSATREEHLLRLSAVLDRLDLSGLTIHSAKCEFLKEELSFFGYIFNKDGVSADPQKVADVKTAPAPLTPTEVRSFLGMATYCGRFIPNLATISEPLRNLTKTSSKWVWDQACEDAFQGIKHALASSSTMAYYDTQLKTELYVDASPVGLGAILVQTSKTGEVRPVAYASRALTPTEQRYSHIEKEAIAILWGCRHFHIYLYGSTFTVLTDHKPLIPIFQGTSPHPPARIEKWLLHLQQYSFDLTYQVGADNPADFLSRHPRPATAAEEAEATDTEEHICHVVDMVRPKSISLDAMRESTLNDPCCEHIKDTLLSGDWKGFLRRNNLRTKPAQEFLQGAFTVRHELSITPDGLILRGARILVPLSLQDTVIALAHEGHQGIVRTKSRIRRRVWFPFIDKKVETFIQSCLPCLSTGSPPRPEPIMSTPRGQAKWEAISADFCTVAENRYLLVVVDDFTRYPEIEIVTSTAADTVIPAFEKMFATHGLPSSVKSDNGPPFQGEKFANYLNQLGISHHKITPRWPQANGDAERFMRTLNKVLRIAKSQNLPWELELYRFLRNYRITPHISTGVAPAELMFRCIPKSSIPHHASLSTTPLDQEAVQAKRVRNNQTMSDKRRARPSKIRPGDHVLVISPPSKSKLCTQYDSRPWTVVEKKGSMVSARRDTVNITRNASFFKVVPRQLWREMRQPQHLSPEERHPSREASEATWAPEAGEVCGENFHEEVEVESPPRGSQEVDEPPPPERQNARYALRRAPTASTRLRDFVCK